MFQHLEVSWIWVQLFKAELLEQEGVIYCLEGKLVYSLCIWLIQVFCFLFHKKRKAVSVNVSFSKEEGHVARMYIRLSIFMRKIQEHSKSSKWLVNVFPPPLPYPPNPQLWKVVPESERREVYEDVVFNLAKREKEENKAMRKRNMKVSWLWMEVLALLLSSVSFTFFFSFFIFLSVFFFFFCGFYEISHWFLFSILCFSATFPIIFVNSSNTENFVADFFLFLAAIALKSAFIFL